MAKSWPDFTYETEVKNMIVWHSFPHGFEVRFSFATIVIVYNVGMRKERHIQHRVSIRNVDIQRSAV